MPTPNLFQKASDVVVALRIDVEDHTVALENALTLRTSLRRLDSDWETFAGCRFEGPAREVLPGTLENLAYAWLYEDRTAWLQAIQAGERLGHQHARLLERRQR